MGLTFHTKKKKPPDIGEYLPELGGQKSSLILKKSKPSCKKKKRKVKKEKDDRIPYNKSIYRTIKVPLKGFLQKPNETLPIFKNRAELIHNVTVRSYQLNRLFAIYKFQSGGKIPTFDSKFCELSLTTVSRPKTNKGRPKNLSKDDKEFQTFYTEHFSPLLEGETIETIGLSLIFQKIAIEMATAYQNNISMHFFPRLKKIISHELNQAFNQKNPQEEIPQKKKPQSKKHQKKKQETSKHEEYDQWTQEFQEIVGKDVKIEEYKPPIYKNLKKRSKDEQKKFSTTFRELMNALHDKNESLAPHEFIEIYKKGLEFLPKHDFDNGSFSYDILSNTNKYMYSTFKMNQYLEEKGLKLFQPLSLRNDMIPKYFPVNMVSLLYLMDFPNLDASEKKCLRSSVRTDSSDNGELSYLERKAWKTYFKIDKKFMTSQKGYCFYSRIDTDGVGCSVTFIKKEHRRKRFKPKVKINQNPYELISDLSLNRLEELKHYTLLGLDPGKSILAMLVDGKGHSLKYSSCQRRYESFQNLATKIRSKIRKDSKLQESESILNDHNSKTMDVNKFKFFIFIKNRVSNEVKKHYNKEIYRKLNLRTFINRRKSEDLFLKRIEEVFGKDVVIGYGNWSRSTQMKFQAPTMGRGLRRKIHRKFQTFSIDEFGTSKYCNLCSKELEHFKKLYRCLVCEGCRSSESESEVRKFINRDINGALNILKCFEMWINEQKRPLGLERTKSKKELLLESKSKSDRVSPALDHSEVKNGKPLVSNCSTIEQKELI